MRVCVFIPAKNEAGSIGRQVESVFGVLSREADEFNVFVVDDHSTDETKEEALDAGATVVHPPTDRRGLSDVYRYGARRALEARADVVVEMDAGGSHSSLDLAKLIRPLARGEVEVCFGSRFMRDSSYVGHWKRELLSRVGTVAFNLRHGTKFTDATSGFIAYTRHAAREVFEVPFVASGHYYQSEVRERVLWRGLSWCEAPISYRSSSSSLNAKSIREAIRLVIR